MSKTTRSRNSKKNQAAERKLAAYLFNHTWELLDKKNRSSEDNDEMIHSAHASRYHWGKVGNSGNLARGEWQISRVYSVLEMPSSALYHGQRCLYYSSKGEGIEDWDVPFAYEALARASAIAGRKEGRKKFLNLARDLGNKIKDPEDRKHLFDDLSTIPAA